MQLLYHLASGQEGLPFYSWALGPPSYSVGQVPPAYSSWTLLVATIGAHIAIMPVPTQEPIAITTITAVIIARGDS